MPVNINHTLNLSEYKYKIELHSHTSPVSPCGQVAPRDSIDNYKELGYDAVTITNHYAPNITCKFKSADDYYDFYAKDYFDALDEGEKIGIKVYFGIEYYIGSCDNLLYGVEPKDIYPLWELKDQSLEVFHESFMSDKRRLFIQAHPFRNGGKPFDRKYVDGYEIMNNHPSHNSQPGFAYKLSEKNPDLIYTGGSDFHDPGYIGLGSILTKELPNDSFELADLLRKREHLFEACGNVSIPVSFRW